MNKIVLILLAAFVWAGCNSASEKTSDTQVTVTPEEHHHEEATETIELENGQKWKVNEEMKPFLTSSESLIQEYMTNHTANYKMLATRLKEKNDSLIKSCTMKGKSHDELHKWLHPHLELVKSLQAAKDSVEAGSLVTKLNESYGRYHQYFE